MSTSGAPPSSGSLFGSLRSQLLASYLLVILIALLMIAVALFGFATLSSVRYLPALQQLAAVSLSNQFNLLELRALGVDSATIERFLDETAAAQDVRILIADAPTRQVIYDSAASDSWVGVTIATVSRPERLRLDNYGDSIFGRFRHPNGSTWLVYARPNPEFGRSLIFYAQPEPTPSSFFRNFFFEPLLVAGVIAALTSLLLALAITRSVTRPLKQMAGAAEAIAQGDYDQQLSLEGPSEVRRVAASFNSMAAQVKTTQQAQRDFLANVSHDLKTPITSVSGWSQALLDGTAASPEEQQRAAGVIHDEAERMGRMVAQLLALARLESGELRLRREPLNVAALLEQVIASSAPRAAERGVQVGLTAPPALFVSADEDRLIEVFANLLDNAISYSPAGATVQVAARPVDNQVEIRVQDQGPGIPAEEQQRVFERFYQVEKSRTRSAERRGAGLGLAIAREIVEAHHGRITLHSRPGQGSTFFVYLPAHHAGESML